MITLRLSWSGASVPAVGDRFLSRGEDSPLTCGSRKAYVLTSPLEMGRWAERTEASVCMMEIVCSLSACSFLRSCVSLLCLPYKIPPAGWLTRQAFILHSSGGRKSMIHVPANSASAEASSWLAGGPLLAVSSQGLSSVQEHQWCLPLLIKTSVMLDEGSILMTSLNLDYFPEDPSSKYSHIGGSHMNSGRRIVIQSITCTHSQF